MRNVIIVVLRYKLRAPRQSTSNTDYLVEVFDILSNKGFSDFFPRKLRFDFFVNRTPRKLYVDIAHNIGFNGVGLYLLETPIEWKHGSEN